MHQSDPDIRNRLLIARLPAMPQILLALIEHLQADDAGMPELAALIARDAGMTSKILTVANSSAYHRNGRAIGLEQSLMALGSDMIKTLVIGESVLQTLHCFPHSGSTDLRAFWRDSLTVAVLARDIAKKMAYPHVEEAYLAGLLHNVGRLALLAAAPAEYGVAFTACDDAALCALEQRTLQMTHAEAGAWLIERWRLDSFMADSVLYHHEPAQRLTSCHPLIRIVRTAHALSSQTEQAANWPDALELCALDGAELDLILQSAAKQVAQCAAMFGIDLAGADDVGAAPVQAAPALDPVQQRLSEQVRNLVLVSELGQTFARQPNEGDLLESVTRSARILFDFENTVILLENPTGHALTGVATSLQQQRLTEFSIALAHGGPVADAALTRRPAFVFRDSQTLGIAEEQLFRILGTDSLVCLPLVTGQRCLGLLIGGAGAWQISGYRKRASLLQSFGNQAAGALEKAQLQRGQSRRQVAQVAEEYRAASRRMVHEVNNPLSIIKNYLSVLDDKLARREPVQGEMSILNEEIDRVGQLINGLAELQPDVRGGADIGRVVGDVLRLFRATDFVPASVQIEVRMQDGPVRIDADPDILKQILVNLIKNAIEALPGGGKIEISQRTHVNRERRLFLELSIGDSGPGLSADVMANLFSAVRSTKAGAQHGLGLSIVHGLVQQIHGSIVCRSGSFGTTFDLLLPAQRPASAVGALQIDSGHS